MRGAVGLGVYWVGERGEMGWAIALHGGAGDIPRSLPPHRREPREAALRHCLTIGVSALKSNQPPLDVVELVVYTSQNTTHLFLFCLSCACWDAQVIFTLL